MTLPTDDPLADEVTEEVDPEEAFDFCLLTLLNIFARRPMNEGHFCLLGKQQQRRAS
eukprot:CAMPEP_0116560306 /NCGR_PEP_ID=MMETSP0397-20121206/10909_1 /TAXON_ID=216820 /ORGANISM="Cyclophora tenuis, Strain ECT3854" /LENGTH=56 /DNA_ID=CAMNT_0004086233 /DNA_START=257 /DNA_END=424 /DNA_ORIENTATION=-